MGEQRGVTLERAGEIIGGDKPLSKRTISAMIRRGWLGIKRLDGQAQRGAKFVAQVSPRIHFLFAVVKRHLKRSF